MLDPDAVASEKLENTENVFLDVLLAEYVGDCWGSSDCNTGDCADT